MTLHDLTERERRILDILRLYTRQEVADVLGYAPGHISNIIQYARKRLGYTTIAGLYIAYGEALGTEARLDAAAEVRRAERYGVRV